MKCPDCGTIQSKVIASHPNAEGTEIRRRRRCFSCKLKFTTYESIEKSKPDPEFVAFKEFITAGRKMLGIMSRPIPSQEQTGETQA